MTGIISLLILLIIIGAVLYIISLLPIDATIKTIIYVVAVVAVAIWILKHIALLGLG